MWQDFLLPLQNEASAHGHQPELIVQWLGVTSQGPTYWISGQRSMLPCRTSSRMALNCCAWMRLRVRSSMPCILDHHASLPASGPFCWWTFVKLCTVHHHHQATEFFLGCYWSQLASCSTRMSRTACGPRPPASVWDTHLSSPAFHEPCWLPDWRVGWYVSTCDHCYAVAPGDGED